MAILALSILSMSYSVFANQSEAIMQTQQKALSLVKELKKTYPGINESNVLLQILTHWDKNQCSHICVTKGKPGFIVAAHGHEICVACSS